MASTENFLSELSQTDRESGNIFTSVKEIVHHTHDIFEIFLDRKDLEFQPGDCISIYHENGETFREYSVASGTAEPNLGFLIKHLENGIVSGFLQNRQPDDQIKISLPYGWFRPGQRHGNGDFFFIATGTGIAPFLSYLKNFPNNPPQQFLYGVRKLNDAVGYELFKKYCPTELAISRERNPGFFKGRVTDLLYDMNFDKDTHFYLCGLDAMIEEVTNWLESNGIDPINIHREVFFYASP
jgi:ferredoxin-NADP reductase